MTGSNRNVAPAPQPMNIMGGIPLAADRLSMSPGVMSSVAGMATPKVKLKFFDQGGGFSRWGPVLGAIGDTLAVQGGGQPIYAQMAERRARDAERALDGELKRMQIDTLKRKASQPNIEHVGDSVGILDPDTGGFEPTYTAPTEAERYALATGAQRGSPGWMTALQDFTLRGRGPTSSGFADNLEDERQGNRLELERLRQSGRENLRSVPTYGQRHPRVPGGVIPGGYIGGRNGSTPPTMSTADLLKQLGG